MRNQTKYNRIEVLTFKEAKEMLHTFFTTQMYGFLPTDVQRLLVKYYFKVKSLDETILREDSVESYTLKVEKPFHISFKFTYDRKNQKMELDIEYDGENTFNV